VSAAELADFTKVLSELRARHKPITALVGEAMRKVQEQGESGSQDFCLQAWADGFFASRIATEMLSTHYVAIMEDSGASSTSVGIVDTMCNPGLVCEEAAAQVKGFFAEREPDGNLLRITVQANNCVDSQQPVAFSYIPRYLFYIVSELLQNSARATLEAYRATPADGRPAEPAPILVTVCADQKQVAIRISDHGGGVSFGNSEKIWSYQFSTSAQPFEVYADGCSPLSGWGMGLPVSRLYAEYLGGKLELMNMPGIGVDAYLFLKRISLQTDGNTSVSSVSVDSSISSFTNPKLL